MINILKLNSTGWDDWWVILSRIVSHLVTLSQIEKNWVTLGKIESHWKNTGTIESKDIHCEATAASTSFYRHCAITENGRDAFLMIRESILKGIQSTADAFVM